MSGTIEDFRPAFAAMGIDERRVDCVEVEHHDERPYEPLTHPPFTLTEGRGTTVRVRLWGNGQWRSRWFAPGEVYARWQA